MSFQVTRLYKSFVFIWLRIWRSKQVKILQLMLLLPNTQVLKLLINELEMRPEHRCVFSEIFFLHRVYFNLRVVNMATPRWGIGKNIYFAFWDDWWLFFECLIFFLFFLEVFTESDKLILERCRSLESWLLTCFSKAIGTGSFDPLPLCLLLFLKINAGDATRSNSDTPFVGLRTIARTYRRFCWLFSSSFVCSSLGSWPFV